MSQQIEAGRCSACQADAERGASGAWWHTSMRAASACPRGDAEGHARFQERQEPEPPRDRQITQPRRDR